MCPLIFHHFLHLQTEKRGSPRLLSHYTLTILDVDLTAFGLFYTTSREVVGAFSLGALYVGLHTTNGSDGGNAIAHEFEVLDAENLVANHVGDDTECNICVFSEDKVECIFTTSAAGI